MIPSVLPALRHILALDSAVKARTDGRVYVGRLPSVLVAQMPTGVITIIGAGGVAEPYLPMHRYRVLVNCYGRDDIDAHYLGLEAYKALHCRSNINVDSVKIGSIVLASGPTMARDPTLNDVPYELLIFSVYAATV